MTIVRRTTSSFLMHICLNI